MVLKSNPDPLPRRDHPPDPGGHVTVYDQSTEEAAPEMLLSGHWARPGMLVRVRIPSRRARDGETVHHGLIVDVDEGEDTVRVAWLTDISDPIRLDRRIRVEPVS